LLACPWSFPAASRNAVSPFFPRLQLIFKPHGVRPGTR
jgi:hypothetical protein